ncbi:MAG: hypothetical protein JRG96_12030 [Deltaproteobacteria bacterium]|nr:hypothetical protein [Deltaproteobacteria bacterium]
MESVAQRCESPRRRRRLGVVSLALLLPALVAAGPQRCPLEGTVYGLTADSRFIEGCFEPLMCPVLLAEHLGGSFRLIGLDYAAPEYQEYLVSDLHFLARLRGEDLRITGSGSYTRHEEFVVQHRLELDLEIDGEPAHFDSGWVVAVPDTYPAIDIRVSKNGEMFFDTVLDLRAIPF